MSFCDNYNIDGTIYPLYYRTEVFGKHGLQITPLADNFCSTMNAQLYSFGETLYFISK